MINTTIWLSIYHLETTDFNLWARSKHETHLSSFQSITSIHVICDVFEKKIDVGKGNLLPTD